MENYKAQVKEISEKTKEYLSKEYMCINDEILTKDTINYIKPLLRSGYELSSRFSLILYKDILKIKLATYKTKYTGITSGYILPTDVIFYDWYHDGYKLVEHLKINDFRSFKPELISSKEEGLHIIEEYLISLPRVSDVAIIVNISAFMNMKSIVISPAIDYSYLNLKYS